MGVYYGHYENKCPRCKTGRATTTFISVSPMSFTARCNDCDTTDFTERERELLGRSHNNYNN